MEKLAKEMIVLVEALSVMSMATGMIYMLHLVIR